MTSDPKSGISLVVLLSPGAAITVDIVCSVTSNSSRTVNMTGEDILYNVDSNSSRTVIMTSM